MVNREWSLEVETLGAALFEFVEIEDDELYSCGVLNVDPRIIAALRINRYEVDDAGRVTAQVELVFQLFSLEATEVRTLLDVECARKSEGFLRQVGHQVCHAYEKARVILLDNAGLAHYT